MTAAPRVLGLALAAAAATAAPARAQPAAEARNMEQVAQLDLRRNEKGLLYANDRVTGGLYILRYTGKQALD